MQIATDENLNKKKKQKLNKKQKIMIIKMRNIWMNGNHRQKL